MKPGYVWGVVLTVLLAAGLLQFTPAAAQDSSRRQEPSAQQQPEQPPAGAQTYTGKIAKVGDKLVLKDSVAKVSYDLDDQEKAKTYEGKDVKVIGTLDASTNTIHVSAIEIGEGT